MFIRRAAPAATCVAVLAACGTADPGQVDTSRADIARISDVQSTFGPSFKVTTVAPAGIDPKLLAAQPLPPGITFDPAQCADTASAQLLPAGARGNMAAVTAEGEGNRFIAIAVETSEPVPAVEPAADCQKIRFTGPAVRGSVEVVDAPRIDGVHTRATHRVVQADVQGAPRTGELYNYVASFGPFLVIVTANPLVVPDRPVAPVDTGRARDLLTAAVAAVRG